MNYSGQGAIEYLLITAAAILVVAVVILAMSGVTSGNDISPDPVHNSMTDLTDLLPGGGDTPPVPVTQNYQLSYYVVDTADDAEEHVLTGDMEALDSKDLELVEESEDDFQAVGVRFIDVNIPQGATVNSAYLEFVFDEAGVLYYLDITIFGEQSVSAPAFTTANNNISNRVKTTASVAWDSSPVVGLGDTWTSPDISLIIEEIIAQPGWAAKSPMVFIISGTGKRTVESYDGAVDHDDLSLAPKLIIDYTITG